MENRLNEIGNKDDSINKDYTNTNHSYTQFKNKSQFYNSFNTIVQSIKNDGVFPSYLAERIKEYYLVNEIIEPDDDQFIEGDYYRLTSKGEMFYKTYFNENN